MGNNASMAKVGGGGFGVVFWMGSWYLCSLTTLFLNKTILTELGSGLYLLSMVQMTTTAALGAVKVYMPGGAGTKLRQEDPNFWQNLFLVGFMRGATVVLGLVGLKHLSPSFTEALQSSWACCSLLRLTSHSTWLALWVQWHAIALIAYRMSSPSVSWSRSRLFNCNFIPRQQQC